MAFNFGAVVRVGEPVDSAFYPVLLDRRGEFERAAGERNIAVFTAKGLTVQRAEDGRSGDLFNLQNAEFQWVLTDRRLVMSCGKYDKGTKWFGFGWGWVVAILFSKATAAVRRRGKCLVGQLDLRWIKLIKYQENHGRLRPGVIIISYHDGTAEGALVPVHLTLYFDKQVKVQPLAQQIVDAATKMHLDEAHRLTDDERTRLEGGLKLAPFDPADKDLVHRQIPGALPASAEAAA
jgi:hypothetical protein